MTTIMVTCRDAFTRVPALLIMIVLLVAAAHVLQSSPTLAAPHVLQSSPTLAAPHAASAADVSAYRPAQAATRTATPRIRLPTETSIATGTATVAIGTGTAPTGTGTAGAPGEGSPTVDVPSGTAVVTADSGGGPGGRSQPTGIAGSGSDETAAIAPPALPGTDEPGADVGRPGNDPGAAGGIAGTAGDRAAHQAHGPSGLIRVPVTDPVVREMWSRFGSPRANQAPLDRLTAGRPLPWSAWPFYLLLAGLFAFALSRVVRDLRAQDRESREVKGDADNH